MIGTFKKIIYWYKEKSSLEKWAYSFTLFGLLIFSWFIVVLIIEKFIDPTRTISLENAARIGDFVGGLVGVFFTLVGVFLLFENLSLQRKELSENRNLILQQQFENTLFSLIQSQKQITNELFIPAQFNENITGRRFFDLLTTEMWQIYKYISEQIYLSENRDWEDLLLKFLMSQAKAINMDTWPKRNQFVRDYFSTMSGAGRIDTERKILKETYFILFKYYHPIYGHYFRHLYHVIKFIYKNEQEEIQRDDKNKSSIANKYRIYADIVQAQLSSFELFILFFNGLCFKEMKKMIHHYNFLENLAVEDLIKPEHVNEYQEEDIDGVKYPAVIFKKRRDLVQ